MAYVIAHRANGSKYKENTKEAILEVLKLPYVDGIEIDIQMTNDKKFIIFHNSFIICNDKKIKSINRLSSKELLKCKKVNLLEELLQELDTKKMIILDLKINNDEKQYMKNFIKFIKKYKHNIYIMSFNYNFVKKLKKKISKFKIGYIKGYFINEEKKKDNLDFCISHYTNYKDEEGIWTVNKQEKFLKYTKKDIILITDHPEFNE